MPVDIGHLSRLVAELHCVEVPTRDLLGLVDRVRFTPSGWAAVLEHLASERLEATRKPAGPAQAWVYHRESAVAMTLETVMTGAPVGTATLQSLGAPPNEEGMVRNLAEVLRWGDCSSLEQLTDRYSGDLDVDDAAINLAGDDTYSFTLEGNGRLEGVSVNNGEWHIPLAYPFDPWEIPDAFDELDRIYRLELNLEDLWEDLDDVAPRLLLQCMYLGDVCQPMPYAAGNERLELTLVTRDDRWLPVARFLRSGEVLFRLGPEDVADVTDRVRIYKSSGPMRVVASADDPDLCAALMLKAAL